MKQVQKQTSQDVGVQNKVYYGEYSIEYWIKLLLRRNIILPPYQRYYIWKQEDVAALVETIKKNRFVPPITVGSFKDGQCQRNVIVDGQQRLTSILLAVLGWFPDKKKFETELIACEIDVDLNESDAELDEVDAGSDVSDNQDVDDDRIMKWTYKELLCDSNKTIEDIEKNCRESGKYKQMPKLEQKYIKDRYIGFCYLVPEDAHWTVDYFANVFMDINANGIPLSPQESRRSLYFLAPDLDALMEPRCLVNVGILNKFVKNAAFKRIDFIRYLSIMNEYYASARVGVPKININRVAVKFKTDPELYYKKFISFLLGRTHDDTCFCKQDVWAYKGDYKATIDALQQALETMGIQKRFDSIAYMDVTFFGLVYWVCYCGRQLDQTKKDDFVKELKDIFENFKSETNYLKSPSQMRKLRKRIEISVKFYERFLING